MRRPLRMARTLVRSGASGAERNMSIVSRAQARSGSSARACSTGTLHFVLPTAIGTCEVVTDVTKDEIAGALTRCLSL